MKTVRPNRIFDSKLFRSVMAVVTAVNFFQIAPAAADWLNSEKPAQASGYSIEARLGGLSEWQVTDASGADAAASGNVSGLAQGDDPYLNSRSFSSAYDDLWWLKSVRAPEAWGMSTGRGVTVAVIDTGVDYSHEDLAGNVWTNAGEIAGNGVDDDGNGYVDDWRGWDFVNGDNDATDDMGHGTHVAGIIGALKDNGKGIAGIAPDARILGIKVLDQAGSGTFANIVKGIRYAADLGARVINLSLGAAFNMSIDAIKTGYSAYYNAVLKPIQDAILYAVGKGSVVVAAAGNSSVDVNQAVPAGFTETISVGATTPYGDRAYFSNFGATMDLSAPGWDVLSLRAAGTSMGTAAGAGYTRASGTSMAAPMVSGVAAMLFAQDPTLDAAGVDRRLKFSSRDLGAAGFDTLFGYGQVDALTALTHDYFEDGTVKTRWLLAADAAGMVRYDYDPSGKTVSSVGEDGTKFFYDANGDRLRYFASGRLQSRTDALTGTVTEYLDEDWNGTGVQRVARRIETDGSVTDFKYNKKTGLLQSTQTVRNGKVVRAQTMDAQGRLKSQVDTDGVEKVTTTYSATGVLLTRRLERGGVLVRTQAMDSEGRLKSQVDYDGARKLTTTYAASGMMLTSKVEEGGAIVRYEEWYATGVQKKLMVFDGSVKTETVYFAGGQTQSVSVWRDGLRVSVTKYRDTGIMQYEGLYEAGVLARETNRFASGQMQNISVWSNGLRVSVTKYHSNGAVQYEAVYKDGLIVSEAYYNSNGRVTRSVSYAPKPDLVEAIRPAPSVTWAASFDITDVRYGYWGVDGQVKSISTYFNKTLKRIQQFYSDGRIQVDRSL